MVNRREFLKLAVAGVGGLVIGGGGVLLARPGTGGTTTQGGTTSTTTITSTVGAGQTATVTQTSTITQSQTAVSNLGDLSTIIIGVNLSGADTLDPALTFDGDACWIPINNAYQHPLQWQYPDFNYIAPDLFSKISVADDKVTWTMTGFASNSKFATGDPLTTKDVEYSLKRAIDIGKAGLMGVYGGLISFDNSANVTATDTDTLVFKTSQPAPQSLVRASMPAMPFGIVNQKLTEANSTGDTDKGTAWMNKGNSAGSGPFIITGWDKASQIIMVPNPNFVGPYPVKFKKVIFHHVADPTSELVLLKKGDIDVMWDPTPQQVDAEKYTQGIKSEQKQQATTYMIWLNAAQKPFDNEMVRQAMKWSVDYDTIINQVILGDGFKIQALSWNGLLGYDSSTPFYKNPEMAKSLLSQAGFPQGIDIEMLIPAGEALVQLAAPKVQADMADCNIRVTLTNVDQADLSGRFGKGDFPSLFWWEGGGLQHIANTAWIELDPRMGLFAKWSNYNDTTVQGLIDACRSATSDADFVTKSLAVTQYGLQHAPAVVMWQMVRQVMMKTAVENLPVPFSRLNVDYGRAYKQGISGFS